MKSKQRQRRGFSSVLAMIYLVLLAVLAVGFYTAVDLSGSIADNEQHVNRSALAAESGLAFGRYAVVANSTVATTSTAAIHLSCDTSQTNLLTSVLANLLSNTNITQMSGTNTPAIYPAGTQTTCSILGVTTPTTQPGIYTTNQACVGVPGWTTKNNVSTPNGMPIDNNGGEAYLVITQVPNTLNINVMSVGNNSNVAARTMQVTFNSPTSANIFTYGMMSYGTINLNPASGVVKITGTYNGNNISLFSITRQTSPGVYTKPINSVGSTSNSIAGDFYYTNSPSGISWGNLSVDGYLPTSGQFTKHVHANTAAPTASPTFNTSSFAPYTTASTLVPGANNTSSLTNASLGTAGNYTFNQPVTINGILYVNPGVNLIFNQPLTVNGAIVAANGTTTGSATFNSTVTQNVYSGGSAETLQLNDTFMFMPNYNVTFNGTTTVNNGSIVAGTNATGNTITFNAGATIANGSIVNVGTGTLAFNAAATIKITPSGMAPSGFNLSDVVFLPQPSSYTENP